MAGEQDEQQRPGATEPGGAADRAGALVRDQIASIANAAQAAADQIDQEAIEASSRAREQALGNARAVHQGLSAIERELDDLLQLVSSQTATLKRSIDRFDARSANAPAAAPRKDPAPAPSPVADAQPALTETVDASAEEAPAAGASAWAPDETVSAPAPDQGASAPAPEPAAAPASEPVAAPASEPAAAPAANAWAPPEGDAVPAPPPEAAPAPQEAAPPAPRTELEEEAWSRVKGKEPAELVALYETATGDRDDDGDEELDWGQYWSAVREAVISEARARPELLIEAPDMSDLGRRQRKSRNKAYEALRDEVAATAA